MPAPEKTVRVFISSTFRDMHAERDHLVTVVFPELRERVEQLGLEFFDVDLRWGVPAKDLNGETANSWEYCRQWIDRVEPFFVCILGQRYGWVPEPTALRSPADQQRQQAERLSITDMEVRHAVLDSKLKRRSFFYLRQAEAPASATEFVDPPEMLEKLERLKARVKTCGRPFWDYPCEWTGNGFTRMEDFGQRVLEDLWSGVLRDERYVPKTVWRQVLNADPDTDPRYTDESQPVPRDLWEKLVKLAKPPPKNPLDAEREQMEAFAQTRLRWFQGRTKELKDLTDFINSTAAEAPRLAVIAAAPGQGKSALLAKLSTLVPQPSTFLITHFVGATERSATAHALVQRLLDELDRSGIEWPADEQKEGEEPKRDFNSLCNRLRQRLGDYAGERRIVILLDALNQLTDGHNLVWLPHRLGPSVRIVASCVDAGGPRSVVADSAAVGRGVPPGSPRSDAATDEPAARPYPSANPAPQSPEHIVLRSLTTRQPSPLFIPLVELAEADVRTIVVEYLKEYCHELDREHLDTLYAVPQTRNPLYLLVMLNELRTLGGNDLNVIVPARIASMSRDYPDTVALFRWVLQRLEVFGTDAVRWWCLYLAHGRVGMASHELADLLARKLPLALGAGLMTAPASRPQVSNPAGTALLIERGLRRYLLRRGGQLDFFHGQLRQAVMEHYGPHAEPTTVHREMADYFTASAKGTDPQKEWETDSLRGFAECVFHLTKAGQHEQSAGLLSNFPFLLHKLRVGLLEGVFEDYDMVRREAPAEVVKRLEIWTDFFREKAHILLRGNEEWPAHKILLQLAVEHADDSPLTICAERWLAEDRCDWLWLRRVPRLPHAQRNPCLAVLEGHAGDVKGALALANGRLVSWSEDKTLRLWDAQNGARLSVMQGHREEVHGALELADGRLLSWAKDKTLRRWDAPSGACLGVLAGHTEVVNDALVLADGRLVSWSRDMTLRIWNVQTGDCLSVLQGHTHLVWGALALADGRLVSWSWDKTLRVWNAQTGNCLMVLQGHTGWILGALSVVDGRLVSWSRDESLRIWNAQTGDCLAVLRGHSGGVSGALALADQRLVSWSVDKSLRVWNVQTGDCRVVLSGHTDVVMGALELADGRLVSWSEDESLRIWNAQTGDCLAVLDGHTGSVRGALELADGRLASWSVDRTLRIYNTLTGDCLVVLAGHTNLVWGTLLLTDERLVSWSGDMTLRVWNTQTGDRFAVLAGHTDVIKDVLALTDGRLVSCSEDTTLRIWNAQTGYCLSVLQGHTNSTWGALALTDGRLVSWSGDMTLRVWNTQTGDCLAVLQGHTHLVWGALVLADGRLVSWSWDKTLRVWNSQTGDCLAVLQGHTDVVMSALVLTGGLLVSWSNDKTLRLWDSRTGSCLEVVSEDQVAKSHPEWVHARAGARESKTVLHAFFADSSTRTGCLRHKTMVSILAAWNAESQARVTCLLADGTIVVTQGNGQVCILKLHHGQRRISLAEAEAILAERGELSAISDQPSAP